MKINLEVECSPEEARRFMGLPDLTPVHDVYIGQLLETMKNGGIPVDTFEQIMKGWAPMSEAGMRVWQQLIDQVTGPKSR